MAVVSTMKHPYFTEASTHCRSAPLCRECAILDDLRRNLWQEQSFRRAAEDRVLALEQIADHSTVDIGLLGER